MHIDTIIINGFRSCDAVTVKMQPDLAVLVGENNGGKSNIIDALRILTLPLNGRRDRYAEEEDLRHGNTQGIFTIEGQFRGLSDTVKGLLISAVPDPTKDLAVFGLRYASKMTARHRRRTTFWAGRFDSTEPEPGSTDLIRHVYLPPLRDARHALGSGSALRITALLRSFLQEGEESDFLRHVQRNDDPHRLMEAVNTEIGTALGLLADGVRPQKASLGFAKDALADVARDLRFRIADAGFAPADISMSGLGYANLLYMATVAVELAKARETDLTLFLVEEPEAHLHPQLQMLVLDFLLAQARKSGHQSPEPGQPEGRIQVIVTTHSPNLTAWVEPKHLVVVRSAPAPSPDSTLTHPHHGTVIIPIADLGLTQSDMDKVSRYLDVTKSALLFGNRALLVEGIAEALLLLVIARWCVLNGDSSAWQRFRGTVLVPIEGVDFAPYVAILLRPYKGFSIADRVVVVTDTDPKVPGDRKANLEKHAIEWGVQHRLTVVTNAVTLEHELFSVGNASLLKTAFLKLHPSSEGRWTSDIEGVAEKARPNAFITLLKSTRTRKGDFAQNLAELIAEGSDFKVPPYMKQAIETVSAP